MDQENSCCCARKDASRAPTDQVEAAHELTERDVQGDELAQVRADERSADSRQAG